MISEVYLCTVSSLVKSRKLIACISDSTPEVIAANLIPRCPVSKVRGAEIFNLNNTLNISSCIEIETHSTIPEYTITLMDLLTIYAHTIAEAGFTDEAQKREYRTILTSITNEQPQNVKEANLQNAVVEILAASKYCLYKRLNWGDWATNEAAAAEVTNVLMSIRLGKICNEVSIETIAYTLWSFSTRNLPNGTKLDEGVTVNSIAEYILNL